MSRDVCCSVWPAMSFLFVHSLKTFYCTLNIARNNTSTRWIFFSLSIEDVRAQVYSLAVRTFILTSRLLRQMDAMNSSSSIKASPFIGMSSLSLEGLRQYADDWRFEPNVTLFSQWYWPVSACLSYFLIVFTLQRLMQTRKPLQIPNFLFVHNILLSVSSLILAIWLSSTLLRGLYNGLSPFQLLCSYSIYNNGHMHLIYYINSFFKVWEFMDTFLLAVRKKPIGFLHAYHHAATLILTWNQMMEHSAPQWVAIVLNLWVHVVMYYYYAMSALGIRIWWKKYLTKLQIVQFVIDVVVIGYAYYAFIRAGFDPNVCYGTSTGAIVGIGILFSYLLLFVRFYWQTYSMKSSKSDKQKQT